LKTNTCNTSKNFSIKLYYQKKFYIIILLNPIGNSD
jgi:hypothetical protein